MRRLLIPFVLAASLLGTGTASGLTLNVHNAPTDKEVQVDLNASDIAAILAGGNNGIAPLQIAPGQSGKWLRVTRLTWMLKPGSELFGYTGDAIYFRVGADSGYECPVIDGVQWSDILSFDSDRAGTIEPSFSTSCPSDYLRGQPLRLWANAQASDITGNGTLRLLIQYQAVAVP